MSSEERRLTCWCGHEYDFHSRRYDAKKRDFEFAHNGPCTVENCGCESFKKKGHSPAAVDAGPKRLFPSTGMSGYVRTKAPAPAEPSFREEVVYDPKVFNEPAPPKAPAPAEGAEQFLKSQEWYKQLGNGCSTEREYWLKFAEAYAASLREQLAQAQLEVEALNGNVKELRKVQRELEEARALLDAEKFPNLLDVATKVFEQYRIEQPKWWARMDGTPILNDVAVRMAHAFHMHIKGALARSTGTKEGQ